MNRCRLGEPTQAERPTPAFRGSQNTAGGRRPRARQPMVTATEIRDLWEAELREEAERLDEPEPQPWEELAYMRWHLLRTSIPVIKPDPERTWLWSDLHLGDETFALLKRRPFPTTEVMDRELLAGWRATVRPDDLIICLGDVAVASFWTDPEHVNDVRTCPGRRLPHQGEPRCAAAQAAAGGGLHRPVLGGDPRHQSPGGRHAPSAPSAARASGQHPRAPARRGRRHRATRKRDRRTHRLQAGPARRSAGTGEKTTADR